MHLRTRRILFWFAVLLFLGITFVTIRYAQGYVYDFETGHFVRTGAVAVAANADAKVFVDDEFSGSLSLVSHRAGKTRLLPGEHMIRLVRDGWSPWSKEFTVEEGLLTEFPNVLIVRTDEESLLNLRTEAEDAFKKASTLADATPLPSPVVKNKPTPLPEVKAGNFILQGTNLLPQDQPASGSILAEAVLGFQPENDRVLWWTRNELWVYWTKDTGDQPIHTAGDLEMLGRWSVPVVRAAWFRDRYHIVVDLGTQGYRILETDTRGGTNIIRF